MSMSGQAKPTMTQQLLFHSVHRPREPTNSFRSKCAAYHGSSLYPFSSIDDDYTSTMMLPHLSVERLTSKNGLGKPPQYHAQSVSPPYYPYLGQTVERRNSLHSALPTTINSDINCANLRQFKSYDYNTETLKMDTPNRTITARPDLNYEASALQHGKDATGCSTTTKTEMEVLTPPSRSSSVSSVDSSSESEQFGRESKQPSSLKRLQEKLSACEAILLNTASLLTQFKSSSVVKTFKCKTCGRLFSRKQDCVRHQLTHTKVKRHCCAHCGVGFARRDNLLRHERTYAHLRKAVGLKMM
ncbi:hypothetical protein BKA69DRAFT_468789 [Paraphysoderma sedebokerense]|nr:hypothetical protein BKA69DRAFT_468789 [Paraphysoderma sedebokerense]